MLSTARFIIMSHVTFRAIELKLRSTRVRTAVISRVENSKDSVCYAVHHACSISRPVELCALKSHASLSTPLLVSPASGTASLAELSDATTLSQGGARVSSTNWPRGLCGGATGVLLDQLGGTAAPPATCE